jgi:hypothetical protein
MGEKNLIGILVVLFLVNAAVYYYFYFSKDVLLKRKYVSWWIYSQFMIIPVTAFFGTRSLFVLLVSLPVAFGIGYLNIRQIAFCDSCAAMQYNKFSTPDSCRKCGTKLMYNG